MTIFTVTVLFCLEEDATNSKFPLGSHHSRAVPSPALIYGPAKTCLRSILTINKRIIIIIIIIISDL